MKLKASISRSHRFCLHAHRRWHANCCRIRNQGDHCAGDHDPDPHPNPHYKRVQMRFDDWPPRILVLALVYQIEVLIQRGVDGGPGIHLLAGFKKTPFGIECVNLAITFEYVDDGPLAAVIRLIFLRIRAADERVRADRHLVAEAHLFFFVLIKCGPGKTDDDDDYPEMRDVAAVAAGVAVGQMDHRGKKILCAGSQSERIGKSVPESTAKQATTNSRLLNRNLDSRETSDSSRCSLRRCS